MSISMYDFLKKEVKKMVLSLGRHEKGNLYGLIMNEMERNVITLVLEETRYNYFQTARILGISRSTLYRRTQALGIQKTEKISEQAENIF